MLALAAAVAFFPSAAAAQTEVQRFSNSDGIAFDRFGTSVGISGDYAVVGARFADPGMLGNRGAAYVFHRIGATWGEQQKLIATDGLAQDQFGISVAISGDTAVVGAYFNEPAGMPVADNNGSAYVFVRSGTTWTQQAQLTASDSSQGDFFGWSVAISGATVIVGAYQDEPTMNVNDNHGAAYVFTRTGTVWTEQQKLTANDAAAGDSFGWSVGINGDTAIVGALSDDSDKGSAYVYTRSASVWTHQQKLTGADSVAADHFGYAVAIAGDTALVGADLDDMVGVGDNRGSGYVFTRSGTVWSEQQKLTANDAGNDDRLGASVALSGDTAVLGAPVAAPSNQGGAYLFSRSGTVWTQQPHLTSSDGVALDGVGNSVATDGTVTLAGADNDGVGTQTAQGSVYVFDAPPTVVLIRSLRADRAGSAVAVRWRAGSEARVLGYRVFRERGGKRVAASRVIRAGSGSGPAARSYVFVDRAAPRSPTRYWLEVLRVDGSTSWAGPAVPST